MPTLEQKKEFYKEELKRVIKEGKLFFCWLCKTVLSGKHITGLQLDIDEPKVSYRCPREDCPNHKQEGYRKLRNLGIPVYDTEIPSDLASIDAPEPPANLSGEDIVGSDEVDGDDHPPIDPANDPRSEE